MKPKKSSPKPVAIRNSKLFQEFRDSGQNPVSMDSILGAVSESELDSIKPDCELDSSHPRAFDLPGYNPSRRYRK
jgi:hypothetical protein